MAKKRGSGGLITAQQFARLLLYGFSGGNMGTKPEQPMPSSVTAGESRGFLDSLIRIAELERKSAEETEGESGLDLIKRNLKDASREGSRRGDNGGNTESPSHDERSDTSNSDTFSEAEGEQGS